MNKLFKILAITVMAMSFCWPVMAQGGGKPNHD